MVACVVRRSAVKHKGLETFLVVMRKWPPAGVRSIDLRNVWNGDHYGTKTLFAHVNVF